MGSNETLLMDFAYNAYLYTRYGSPDAGAAAEALRPKLVAKLDICDEALALLRKCRQRRISRSAQPIAEVDALLARAAN